MVQSADSMREKMFTMRFSEEESARLEYVASSYGLTAAGLFRMLLKREETSLRREEGNAPSLAPTKKPKPRK